MSQAHVLYQDRGYYGEVGSLEDAIDAAGVMLGGVPEGEFSTFTVETTDGKLMAAVTNRRITGAFYKQEWGGRKNDMAISCGVEEFDATDAVLLLSHAQLIELQDNAESSDEIGRSHVDWSGPCSVELVQSVLEFFGVSDLEDITEEALAFARSRLNPLPAEELVVTLSVNVKVRVAPGISVEDFVDNLDYSIKSGTPGVVVTDTEIVEAA